jgi:hypothetical protein
LIVEESLFGETPNVAAELTLDTLGVYEPKRLRPETYEGLTGELLIFQELSADVSPYPLSKKEWMMSTRRDHCRKDA